MAPYVGYLAAFLGTICWIPQAVKAWATRDTSGLSLPSNLLFLTTVSLWLVYGVMIGDWPLILANICAVVAMLSIVAAKLRFK
ncbi:Sugar transporter SemiSWEET [Roseovarius sp. EC-HK134]|jgi:MtN3 and saliva related transmembrane protein|uniref:Sugar transporter SemiSWEET n=1 Tax=Roseovarius mucosus TaxID=215743 RepID=A0A1V0RKL6_9RHOB|nr:MULTISPECIES: SemiSWEET transporter [Roseovarius]ARE82318.1 sugar transporter SemiSWEET [Roseovarius mucosus]MBW4972641.1 SemiSWEET transporter [Roseovarius mucosus]VVT32384.1 Sugar transporter SemiSWEET [Roseovarius sp. EC-HK134]VVT32652.1 Sugar transporter SemiSWEET [Roseovarius sp. EC-SD190]|tara:strand:- start:2692 stop:2940 length:249 start_codon:yes stop_codon:yes gene_type:complete